MPERSLLSIVRAIATSAQISVSFTEPGVAASPQVAAGPAPIRWASSEDRYSPVQDRRGLRDPQPGECRRPPSGPASTPTPTIHPATLAEREILRATYQGDDRCQLHCLGCSTGDRLNLPIAQIRVGSAQSGVPAGIHRPHPGAGRGLAGLLPVGRAEATMDPEGSAAKLR